MRRSAHALTINYDGYEKHTTVIGTAAFIGSNSSLIAPVRIGDGAFVVAGSTVTQDVPDDAMAFGRARQTNKAGLAAAYRARQAKRKDGR